jgi:8-oxo-dGTP pyrophosphatase MutT (NUDIX family)
MDHWNFLGGKIERDESPAASARRELAEEAGIHSSAVRTHFRGLALWPHEEDRGTLVGMYLFTAALSRSPRRVAQTFLFEEGILAWWSATELQDGRAGALVPNLELLLEEFFSRSRTPRLTLMWHGPNDQIRTEQVALPKRLRSAAAWPLGPAALRPGFLFGQSGASDQDCILVLPTT